MYTDKKNILELAGLLKAHGIRKMVLCPGSRNIAIVQTLANIQEFTCYPVTDERSAGFFAIGLSLESNEAVAICCTSGSALVNLHPAVSEAFYQQIPLIVISADRPKAWIGQMDGQTLPQDGVFGKLVKMSVSLPDISTEEDLWYCNRLVNEALLETHHHGNGPVHINVPIDDPFFDLPVSVLPDVRKIERLEHPSSRCIDELAREAARCRSCMAIAGQSSGDYLFSKEAAGALEDKFVWLGESICNKACPVKPLSNLEPVLASLDEEGKQRLKPDLLITFGGHVISKRLKKFLRRYKPSGHWHISKDGEIADLYCSLTKVIETDPEKFLEQFGTALERATAGRAGDLSHGYIAEWKQKADSIPSPDFPYSEMMAIGHIQEMLPSGSILHLANSSSVRYSQLFSLPENIKVFSNRGINGIEGSMSAAIGCSCACKDKLNFLFIGDLSFFYDMNALWNNNYGSNIRILLLNNSGGEIFKALPGLDLHPNASPIVLADHDSSAKAWTRDRGFRYLEAHDAEELELAARLFTDKEIQDKPMLLEVFTDKDEDVRALKEWYDKL